VFTLPLDIDWWLGVLISLGFAVPAARFMTRKVRSRRRVLQEDFPAHWETILKRYVPYYVGLEPHDQQTFRELIQVFLDEVPVIGIEIEVDETDRVLTAASAIIPIMGFPDWEYSHVSEVLLYPGNFNADFQTGKGDDKRILGMVSSQMSNGVVILSKPALRSGFANPNDKRNVGVHEFVHMVDKADGSVDGAPGVPRDLFFPWMDFIEAKLKRCGDHWGDINPYGATNRQEFLAVTSEYFFENPDAMARKHPELYDYLSQLYRQSPIEIIREGLEHSKVVRVSRNSPCPCGSGKKHKHCCLGKTR
jgi:Mlc titration factor MtfA (ptsG expression regulator)